MLPAYQNPAFFIGVKPPDCGQNNSTDGPSRTLLDFVKVYDYRSYGRISNSHAKIMKGLLLLSGGENILHVAQASSSAVDQGNPMQIASSKSVKVTKPGMVEGTHPGPSEKGERANAAETTLTTAKPNDPDFMTSLARGLSVMQAFTRRTPRMTPSQVSTRTGLSRAAVRRCLHTLHQLGFVDIEGTNQFSLSQRVLTLSHAYSSSSRLPRAAQPILETLSSCLHESCSVATLVDDELLYVARAHVSRIMTVDLAIGSRLPAYCTSMGRVLLAHLQPEQLDKYLERVALRRHTPRTIISPSRLRKILREVRLAGFAMVDQELEEGLRSLAVPVWSAENQVVAAMNIGTHAQRMPVEEINRRFLPQLQAAARELSRSLR